MVLAFLYIPLGDALIPTTLPEVRTPKVQVHPVPRTQLVWKVRAWGGGTRTPHSSLGPGWLGWGPRSCSPPHTASVVGLSGILGWACGGLGSGSEHSAVSLRTTKAGPVLVRTHPLTE